MARWRYITGNRRGDTLIEFTLVGIPLIFVAISLVTVSVDMWQFHDLPYSVDMTARYVTSHGQGCSQNGNTCMVTIGNIASYFASQSIALDPSLVNVTLTDGSGSTNCDPLNSCLSNASTFPNTNYNSPGQDITIHATYTLRNPIAMFWPPDRDSGHDFTVGATSRQGIVF